MVLVPQLVYMFNLSLSLGIFPDKWKRAAVVPLHKGGDLTRAENYRPVSLLPLPGKILEKIVHAHFNQFLNQNNVITSKQSGFRKDFSTVSAVADLTDNVFTAINNSEVTLAAFVYLRKGSTQ